MYTVSTEQSALTDSKKLTGFGKHIHLRTGQKQGRADIQGHGVSLLLEGEESCFVHPFDVHGE